MTVLYFIAFFLMTSGLLALFRISPLQLLSDLYKAFSTRKIKMKKQIQQSIKPKKLRGIRRIILEAKEILRITHQSERFSSLCIMSLILFVTGILISGFMSNLFLMPVLAVGFSLLPFLFVLFSATRFRRELNGELETALSIITSSYNRSNNILLAVQENIDYLNSPVREVFQKFLTQASLIDADIPKLLDEMKDSTDNSVFQEWCKEMVLCQDNRNLKSSLTPIVDKLSDIRTVTGDLENILYDPMKEDILMSILLVANIPLIRTQSAEWFHTLMYSIPGQITLTLSAIELLFSLMADIRSIKPVEYKR